MSKVVKGILIVFVTIVLIMLIGLGLGLYYFNKIINSSNIEVPVIEVQEIQENVSAYNEGEAVELPEFTEDQEKALSALGIDPEKLNEPATQNCIVENIGEERITELMSGKEKPGITDILKFKKCF